MEKQFISYIQNLNTLNHKTNFKYFMNIQHFYYQNKICIKTTKPYLILPIILIKMVLCELDHKILYQLLVYLIK